MERDEKQPREPDSDPDPRVPVMSWLVEVGQAVVRKFKVVPPSPLTRIHD